MGHSKLWLLLKQCILRIVELLLLLLVRRVKLLVLLVLLQMLRHELKWQLYPWLPSSRRRIVPLEVLRLRLLLRGAEWSCGAAVCLAAKTACAHE